MGIWQQKPFELAEDGLGAAWEEERVELRADFQAMAVGSGHEFKRMAREYVESAGGLFASSTTTIGPYPVDGIVRSHSGREFYFLARGTPDEGRQSGLRRVDTVLKLGFIVIQLRRRSSTPVLVVTSDLPERASKAGRYLADLADDVWDVVAVRGDLRGFQRLRSAFDGSRLTPLDAPWRSRSSAVDGGGQCSFLEE